MGEEFRRTLYHAALGSTVGTVVATVSQEASNMVNAQLVAGMGTSPTTSVVLSGVVAGSITAIAMLAGDKVITAITPMDDPLFRVFYYNTIFHNSNASWGFVRAIRVLLKNFTGPQYSPGPVIHKAPPQQKAEAGCGGTSCGNIVI